MTYKFKAEYEADENSRDLIITYEVSWGNDGSAFGVPNDQAFPPEHDRVEIVKVEEDLIDPWNVSHISESSNDDHYDFAESIEDQLLEHAKNVEAIAHEMD